MRDSSPIKQNPFLSSSPAAPPATPSSMSPDWGGLLLLADVACVVSKAKEVVQTDSEDDRLNSILYKLWEAEYGDAGQGQPSSPLPIFQVLQEEERPLKKRKGLSGKKIKKKKDDKKMSNPVQENKKKMGASVRYTPQRVQLAPPWLDTILRRLGASGTELFVLTKGVTKSDTIRDQNRLLLSFKGVEATLLRSFSETEKAAVSAEKDLKVVVFDGEGRDYEMDFTYLRSNNGFRIKGDRNVGWGKFLTNNALRPIVHDLYLYAFRVKPEDRLRMAIVKAEKEGALKLEKVEVRLVECISSQFPTDGL